MKKTIIFISTMMALCFTMFSCKSGSNSSSANGADNNTAD